MNIQLTEAAEFRRNGPDTCQGTVRDRWRSKRDKHVHWRYAVMLKPHNYGVGTWVHSIAAGLDTVPYNFVRRHSPGEGADIRYHRHTQPSKSEDAAGLATEKARRCIRQAADHTHCAKDTPDVTAARKELERAVWLLKYVEGL